MHIGAIGCTLSDWGNDMREQFEQLVSDSTPGRFEGEGPMTAYVWNRLMDGDYGDDELRWGDGSSSVRFGRRVLSCSSTGFVGLDTFKTPADAERFFDSQREDELRGIVNMADDVAQLWTDCEGEPYWLDEANVSPEDVQGEITRQYGELLNPDVYETVTWSRSRGVAYRVVSPSWPTRVQLVAVGDDHIVIADASDLTPVTEGDYCPGCGQIGCGWGS